MFGKTTSALYKVAQIFHEADKQCFLVGGAVRDYLLDKAIKDFDLATDAYPQEVMKLFKKVIPTGMQHGTVTVLFGGERFEITTFRTEGTYSDCRRPDSICFIPNILDDLKRRDFTINSIAYNLQKNKFYDPNRGRADLKKSLLKAIGNPLERFKEDGLRPLRALRFVAQLGFKLDKKTYKAINSSLAGTASVSKERIAEEMAKLCQGPYAAHALFLMRDSGMLKTLFPSLAACQNFYDETNSRMDLLTRGIMALEAVPRENLIVRLAALLQFIGKAALNPKECGSLPAGSAYEQTSAAMAVQLGKEYRVSNFCLNSVERLVSNCVMPYRADWSAARVRQFIAHAGAEHLDDLFMLYRANVLSLGADQTGLAAVNQFHVRVREALQGGSVFAIGDLAVNGADLLKLGAPKGPLVGKTLRYLLAAALEDPRINRPDVLLALAKEFLNRQSA